MLVPTTTTPYEQTSMDVDYNDAERALFKQAQDKVQAAEVAAAEAQKAQLAAEQAEKEHTQVIQRINEQRAKREEAEKERARQEEARLEEERARQEEARLEEERARQATKARQEKKAREKEKAARRAAEDAAKVPAKDKARVRPAAIPQEPPHRAHSSNRKPQAGVATSFVKGPPMHKGVEADDESGHLSEEETSDVIMEDAETTVSTSLLAFTRRLKPF
jgi:hypothetical protein